jgi:hypothetical protein
MYKPDMTLVGGGYAIYTLRLDESRLVTFYPMTPYNKHGRKTTRH